MFRFQKFKGKMPIHRDQAAVIFVEHCHKETTNLLDSIIRPLNDLCDGKNGRPSFDDVMMLPLLSFDGKQFKSKPTSTLIEAHCYAMATAIGLDTLRHHIDPSSQADVMEWMLYKRIVEEDVGRENVGTPPSPWLTPKDSVSNDELSCHVQWAPGTFENGIPSQIKQLTDRYRRLSASQKGVILLIALKIFLPHRGVHKALYRKTEFGGGLIGLNQIGSVPPDRDSLDEWEDDLQVTNAHDALSELPADIVASLIAVIDMIDPFWPTFGKSHRVTWK